MSMNSVCEICRGACCEFMALNVKRLVDNDTFKWLAYHGKAYDSVVEIDAPCKHLENGKCQFYDSRPALCKNMDVGSAMCRIAIVRQRFERKHEILNQLITASAGHDADADGTAQTIRPDGQESM